MTEATNFFAAETEPYYVALGDEIDIFRAAYSARLPVLLKGPTGCGKTRFVEHMTWRLYRETANPLEVPLITVSCHEDLTATDMVGRYLLKGDETVWNDGPLTRAVRTGAMRELVHRAVRQEAIVKIAAVRVGGLVSPGPDSGILATRRLLPFRLARQTHPPWLRLGEQLQQWVRQVLPRCRLAHLFRQPLGIRLAVVPFH